MKYKLHQYITGFTLVELMLVVTILGILVATVAPRLAGRAEIARRAAASADLASIALAVDLYAMDTGALPDTLDALIKDVQTHTHWNGPYLRQLPMDPWGQRYVYRVPGQQNIDYDLASLGADGRLGGADDIANWEMSRQL